MIRGDRFSILLKTGDAVKHDIKRMFCDSRKCFRVFGGDPLEVFVVESTRKIGTLVHDRIKSSAVRYNSGASSQRSPKRQYRLSVSR